MDLYLIISNPDSALIATGLGKAAVRSGISWAAFVTNDGVCALDEQDLVDTLKFADAAIVCQESWCAHRDNVECPIEAGSQTNNSAMIADAKHVISL